MAMIHKLFTLESSFNLNGYTTSGNLHLFIYIYIYDNTKIVIICTLTWEETLLDTAELMQSKYAKDCAKKVPNKPNKQEGKELVHTEMIFNIFVFEHRTFWFAADNWVCWKIIVLHLGYFQNFFTLF